jgi:hypothetical protein
MCLLSVAPSPLTRLRSNGHVTCPPRKDQTQRRKIVEFESQLPFGAVISTLFSLAHFYMFLKFRRQSIDEFSDKGHRISRLKSNSIIAIHEKAIIEGRKE